MTAMTLSKSARAAIAQDILNAKNGVPTSQTFPDSLTDFCRKQAPSLLLDPESLQHSTRPLKHPCELSVVRQGSIEQALDLRAQGQLNVGILVFCSARRPGGGWLSGANAQEETISLCSTWALGAHHPKFHEIEHQDCTYSNAILTLHGHILSSQPGQYLPTPEPATFIGFAAPNLKALEESGVNIQKLDFRKRCLHLLTERCSLALDAFEQAQCDSVVLGPIGCGVFRNDPEIVAQAWVDALASKQRGFSHIDFALSDQPNPAIAQAFESIPDQFERTRPHSRLPRR